MPPVSRSLRLLLLACAALAARARFDTSALIGSAYTPAGASNTLWWPWHARYAAAIDRELGAAARRLSLTTLRVFLHTLVWEADGPAMLDAADALMAAAEVHGIKVGLVLFDSCWNTDGANVSVECVPIKGRHNGCWYESPLFSGQTSLARYQPYVEAVTQRFGNDSRLAWLEIYNEPRGPGEDFVFALRSAAYAWATALRPRAPVISCWDDNNSTQIIDHHEYDVAFNSSWAPALYANSSMGAIITEGGSRWYQPPFEGDYGSPLTVLNFLQALRLRVAAGTLPFVPGAILNWELMVGNSNTRWHWGSPDGAAEPAIPWDGWIFPDGTPVSHTEAGAMRRYVTGVDEFLIFEKFLTAPPIVEDGDAYLTVPAGTAWQAPSPSGAIADALIEAAVWLDAGGAASLLLRAGALPPSAAAARGAAPRVVRHAGAARYGMASKMRGAPPSAAAAAPAPPSCAAGALLNDTDVCPGGPPGYRDMDVAGASDPLATCAAACCAWSACSAWIVRAFEGSDGNCSNTAACCWLKPGCTATAPAPGATSAFVLRPPGPPLPALADGYNVTLLAGSLAPGSSSTLLVSRAQGGASAVLASFNLSTLENGLVCGAWNLLRVLAETQTNGSLTLSVFFNPMFGETGFVGNASDALRTPLPIPPRLVVNDAAPLPPGAIAVAAGLADARIDYISALPAAVAH